MDSTNIIIPFDFPFAILEHRHYSDPNTKLVYAVADGQYTYGPLSLYQYHNDETYSKTMRTEELPPSLSCKEYYIVESGFSTDGAVPIIDENRGLIYVKEILSSDDENNESILTMEQESEQVHMKELFKEMAECKSEIQSLKSIVLSENRFIKCRSTSTDSPGFRGTDNNAKWIRGGGGASANRSANNGHMSDDGGVSTPLRYTKATGIRKPQQVQSSIVQRSVSSYSANRNVLTPLRSKTTAMSSVTTKYATPMRTTTTSSNKKVVLKNIKSSGYGQFTAVNNTTTTIKKQQQQTLATLATPGRSFRK
ncbi:unnamed protein product [Rotaria socialis]|uniref:Uncharacterized protein n=1 Tax=Rotaria socialis TaxID=392032 RepID=A0A819X1B9_9BILA|nr:unnamed protein product [Rotaria socialis]CAF3325508.1 unnamed protein product [Rotaria socialis]CAF3644317.1 unnamed protein product [Rotaria socialis]CAF3657371.1 unnamed protein product [Rotaria socialis]CAF4133674.1 unnamed protein product [Rotaria socialis]